jgi:hypothetical protein
MAAALPNDACLAEAIAKLLALRPCQSPAKLIAVVPVISPSASKPNRRLAASPRGNTSFTRVECLVVYRALLHDFGTQR